jgi:hypothetical protein
MLASVISMYIAYRSSSENRIQNYHLEQESASDTEVTNGAAVSH